MPRYSIVLIVFAILSGCVGPATLGNRYDEIAMAPLSDDSARLVIYLNRFHQFKRNNASTYVNVFIDGDKVGRVHTNTFRVHTVPPGEISISADDRGDTPTAWKATVVVMTFGASAKALIEHNASFINIPAELEVAGGEVYYFRADWEEITLLEECEKSGDEAQLCEVQKSETRIRQIPAEQALQELMALREISDDPAN
jgi:hypothetical protein